MRTPWATAAALTRLHHILIGSRDVRLQFACSMWCAFSELSTAESVSTQSVQSIVTACQMDGGDDTFPYTVDKFMTGFIALFNDDKYVGCAAEMPARVPGTDAVHLSVVCCVQVHGMGCKPTTT